MDQDFDGDDGDQGKPCQFDRQWAEYYNQMKDAQEVMETQVCIKFYFIATLKNWFWLLLLLSFQ